MAGSGSRSRPWSAILIGLLLTRDTDHRSAERDRQAGRIAIAQLEARASRWRKDGRTAGGREHRARAGPAAGQRPTKTAPSSPSSARSRRCADGQRRAGQRRRARRRRPLAGRSDEELEAAEFKRWSKTSTPSSVEEGHVDPLRTAGGATATHGSTVTIFVSSGPKLVKVPVLVDEQRRVAVQQIRGRGLSPRSPKRKRARARRASDPPVAERGPKVEAGSTVRSSSAGRASEEDAERDRQGTARSGGNGARSRPHPGGRRRRNRIEARSAASPDQFPPPAPKSHRAPK